MKSGAISIYSKIAGRLSIASINSQDWRQTLRLESQNLFAHDTESMYAVCLSTAVSAANRLVGNFNPTTFPKGAHDYVTDSGDRPRQIQVSDLSIGQRYEPDGVLDHEQRDPVECTPETTHTKFLLREEKKASTTQIVD